MSFPLTCKGFTTDAFPLPNKHTCDTPNAPQRCDIKESTVTAIAAIETTQALSLKDNFPHKSRPAFRESAWVVSKAAIAVTVDSFISHLCGALGVSQVCL